MTTSCSFAPTNLAAPAAKKKPKKGEQSALVVVDDNLTLTDYTTGEEVPATAGKVVVTLNNNDLPRVINGRPGDPIEKRPFARHFTKAKILSSVRKLGLYPIDAEQACSHPKVRDDTKTVGKVAPPEALQGQLAANLAELSKLGVGK